MPESYLGYKIVGLNNRFRFSRYKVGGEFTMHCDDVNYDDVGNRSMLTLNIFLNDKTGPCENLGGGSTSFYYEDLELRKCVEPVAGLGALFYHY